MKRYISLLMLLVIAASSFLFISNDYEKHTFESNITLETAVQEIPLLDDDLDKHSFNKILIVSLIITIITLVYSFPNFPLRFTKKRHFLNPVFYQSNYVILAPFELR